MQNQNDVHLVTPATLEDLIKAIQEAKKEHGPKLMYRGQTNASWEINSSFSRGFTRKTLELIRNPATSGDVKSYGFAQVFSMTFHQLSSKKFPKFPLRTIAWFKG